MAAKMQGKHLDLKITKKLADSIILGRERIGATLDLLDQFERQSGGQDMLVKYRDEDETLLHLATKFHEDATIVEKLVSLCPNLLTMTRSGKYEGQTALHIAISKENYDAVEIMVKHPEKRHLLTIPATGSRFTHTVMMGELPLSVAAMTFNDDIVLELLNGGAKLVAQNSYGDTVFHSLVKFSSLHADNQQMVINMMTTLNNRLAKRSCEKIETIQNFPYEETDPVAVWLYPNYEHLTPLQLAGKLGQIEIFNYILNIEGVYCRLDRHDGLFDINLYDITEIDSVAMQKWFSNNRRKKTFSKIVPQNIYSDPLVVEVNKNKTRFNRSADPKDFQSVLVRISKIDVQQAFAFLLLPVIRSIIKDKWSRYRWYYYSWALFHLTHMSFMIWYATERAKFINITASEERQNSFQDSNSSQISNPTDGIPQYVEHYLNIFTIINIIVPILYLLFEFRRLVQKQYWHLSKIHHNGTYRLLLLLFSLSALADSVWYKFQPGYNYFLIISVLIGCWFLTFFLRAFKKFSFFTVMIQKVIISDLFRFSIIIMLELISFTAMIYMLFLQSREPVDEFRTYRTSLLTMFNLMLGLSDITVLNQADEPWLVVGLFVLFALLTYVLMINALIAMMSQTCAMVSSNKHTQWQLQRLSIIIFIENTVLTCMKKCSGEPKFVKHFDIKQKTMIQEERYFLELDSLQMSYSKGAAILRRRDLAQTVRFGDVNALLFHSGLPSSTTGTPQTQSPATYRSQNTGTPHKHYRKRQFQHKYKKHKESDYCKILEDSNELQVSEDTDESQVYHDSNMPQDPQRFVPHQMLRRHPDLKEFQQTSKPIQDPLLPVTNTIQTSEPIKNEKVPLTSSTVEREIQNGIRKSSEEKGEKRKHKKKHYQSTQYTADTASEARTKSASLLDYHKQNQQETTPHKTENRQESVTHPKIDISTVYVSN